MRRIVFTIVTIIFYLSLLFLIFSVYQLMSSKNEIARALNDYEKIIEAKQFKGSSASQSSLYPIKPTLNDVVGILRLETIGEVYPIIEGTEQEQLTKGVGHYTKSVLPGERDNSVLAGHRDTVFARLGELSIGDRVEVETVAGNFTYEVIKEQIVDSDDLSIIVSHDIPILTLVTCYPFRYIGPAPQRFILTLKLVNP